jgi:hypothetical protein
VLRADEVVGLDGHPRGPDVATLARWIVKRQVVALEWQSQTWLPGFQFDPADMVPLPTLDAVLAPLRGVYDAWELADWFARPSNWLGDRPPIDLFASDLPAVIQAARADRFVFTG